MRGIAGTGSRNSATVGISAATSEARRALDIAHAIQPNRTNSTAVTATNADAPGSFVSSNITQPITTVEGMVTTQATTISPTTLRLTPCPEATPEPVTDDAAAWVVEIGIPIAVAPKIELTAPMLAASPELARSEVIRRPSVSMIFQPPQIVPAAMAE